MFVASALLYAACVLLPAGAGLLFRKFEEHEQLPNKGESSFLLFLIDEITNSVTEVICPWDEAALQFFYGENAFGGFLSICQEMLQQQNQRQKHMFMWSPDAAWTDLAQVAILSLALAIIRMAITRLVVPLHDPERVRQMVRMKSVSLLSKDYQLTPVTTRKTINFHSPSSSTPSAEVMEKLRLPAISSQTNEQQASDDAFVDDVTAVGMQLDHSENEDHAAIQSDASKQSTSAPKAVPPSPVNDDDSWDEASEMKAVERTAEAVGSKQKESSVPHGRDKESSDERMNSGPRMATAIFRFVYSVLAAVLALVFFRGADFWPPYVLGHGATEKCWDLSGGLSLGLDGDFDLKNAVLKSFFLWQASYHWHAGAFHIISALFLSFLERDAHEMFYWVPGTHSRSLAQHTLALVLIGTCYIFSSLRRLGAIGMFAFDFSSIFLHLLQVCLNSNPNSYLRNSRYIRILLDWFVLPSFCYTRFVVWPALWWSATTEGNIWLQQFELTTVPGAALLLQSLWNISMIFFMAFNVVYFRRLLNHPHLRRILQQNPDK